MIFLVFYCWTLRLSPGFCHYSECLHKLQVYCVRCGNLSVGQILEIPSNNQETNMSNTYVVKSGDSLWNIENRLGTSVNEL